LEHKEEHQFANFCTKVIENAKEWEAYQGNLDDATTFFESMPQGLAGKLETFEKLIIVKIFKP